MSKDDKAPQRWDLSLAGHEHRVEVRDVGLARESRWYVDGVEVARRRSSGTEVELVPEAPGPDGTPVGAVSLRFSTFGGARRVTHFEGEGGNDAEVRALLGLGGVDFLPEPGSKAARREEMIRLHPHRYTAQRTAVGAATVLVPLLLGLLVVRFVVSLPWPDLPAIPWPDVPWPDVPWPDVSLPDLPWPHLPSLPWPDWELPGWLRWLLDKAGFVWPAVLALLLARGEVNRRRKQDALRAEQRRTAQASALDQQDEEEKDDA